MNYKVFTIICLFFLCLYTTFLHYAIKRIYIEINGRLCAIEEKNKGK